MFTNNMAQTASSVSLSILVVIEMMNALNALSVLQSLLCKLFLTSIAIRKHPCTNAFQQSCHGICDCPFHDNSFCCTLYSCIAAPCFSQSFNLDRLESGASYKFTRHVKHCHVFWTQPNLSRLIDEIMKAIERNFIEPPSNFLVEKPKTE